MDTEDRISHYMHHLEEALTILDESGWPPTPEAIRMSKNCVKAGFKVLGKIGSQPKRGKNKRPKVCFDCGQPITPAFEQPFSDDECKPCRLERCR